MEKNKETEVSNTNAGIYVHKFKTPFEFEGVIYETLTFKFNELKGEDMIDIENEMAANNEYAIAPELSTSFLCRMCAKAGHIGSDVLAALPILEFSKIRGAGKRFLLNMD